VDDLSGLFSGDERKRKQEEMRRARRLPPGQSLTLKWPVLHYGNVPKFDPETWRLRMFGLLDQAIEVDWQEFSALPRLESTSDFHCVTRWSRFDNRWSGVAMKTLLAKAGMMVRKSATDDAKEKLAIDSMKITSDSNNLKLGFKTDETKFQALLNSDLFKAVSK
jgi:DMSO/TMAO reductase YedYZ molybdopterin-dependent catalytic subunit